METKISLTLLALVGILLALTSPVAGGMKATFAGGSTGSWSGDAAALGRLMSTRLEDGVAPELGLDLEVHRRILANNIGPSVFNAKKPVCLGNCGGRGQPYTNRGCLKIYQCRG